MKLEGRLHQRALIYLNQIRNAPFSLSEYLIEQLIPEKTRQLEMPMPAHFAPNSNRPSRLTQCPIRADAK